MNPEEYLDRLIERNEHGELYIPSTNDDVAASIAAAEALVQLKEINIPHGFANNLELSIRACAHSLTEQSRLNIPLAQSRSPIGRQSFFKRRTWVALLRVAAVFFVACVGVLTASARSLPGDALYSLKQAETQFTLTFAGAPQNRASLQIDHLRSALVDLNTVVNQGRDDDAIRLALDTVAAKTSDSLEVVAALPMDSERAAAQQNLDSAIAQEEQALRQLFGNVDWPVRLAFTQQLGALGDPVPTVTNVVVRPQSNGTLLITLTGSHFAPQAQLMIGGRQIGMVNQSIPTQLVAVLSNTAWTPGVYAIGVRNPDGTAAQFILNSDDGNNSDRQDSNHNRRGTPVPYPTGGSDN